MGEPKALLALALEPPNLDDIEKTILLLKEVLIQISLNAWFFLFTNNKIMKSRNISKYKLYRFVFRIIALSILNEFIYGCRWVPYPLLPLERVTAMMVS